MTTTKPKTKRVTHDQWIAQMLEVKEENRRVGELNKGIISQNFEIRKANIKRSFRRLPLVPLLRVHKVEAWARELKKRETEIRRALNDRSPQTWARKVEAIQGKARQRVACIVWWDFFSDRPVKERMPHLDRFMACRLLGRATDEEVVAGLCKVGYSPWMAENRMNGDDVIGD